MTSVTHIRFTTDSGAFMVVPLDQLRRAALRYTQYMSEGDPRTKFFATMNSTTRRIHDQYVNPYSVCSAVVSDAHQRG